MAIKKYRSFQFKVTKVTKDASEDCIIEGYANTKDKDRVGDVVMPSAFEKSLPTYMSNPVLLSNHDWNDPCGVVQSAEVQENGLYVKARISDTRPDIKTLIREGCVRTFSIGYNEVDADFDQATQTKFIKELELLEISIVTVPANAQALFVESGANLAKPTDGGGAADAPKPQSEAADAEPKSAPKTFEQFEAFLSDVKSAVEGDLDGKQHSALVEYFNNNEDIMTREELLAQLRSKSLPVAAPAQAAKAPESAAPSTEQPAADAAASPDLAKMCEAMMAKMDAMAEGMAKLLEMQQQDLDQDAGEKPAADKPADAPKPDAKPADDKPADAPAKDAGEMTDDEVQKSLDELDEQIADLEDQE